MIMPNRLLINILITMLGAVILVTPAMAATTPQQELATLRSNIANLQAAKEATQEEYTQLRNTITNINHDTLQAEADLAQIHDQLTVVNSQYLIVKQEYEQNQQQLAEQRDDIAQYLLVSQNIWLHNQPPSNLSNHEAERQLSHWQQIQHHLRQQLQHTRQQQQLINKQEQELSVIQANIAVLKDKQQQTLQQLLHQKNMSLERMQQQNKRLSQQDQSLLALLEDEQRLTMLIANLAAAQVNQDINQHTVFPVNGEVITSFNTPLHGQTTPSQGWHYQPTQSPAPVRAVRAGKVVFAHFLRGFNHLVIIDHGDNFLTLYAQQQELYVQTGEDITAGQVIGQVVTHNPSQAPFYFEIRQHGKPIDPTDWLNKE